MTRRQLDAMIAKLLEQSRHYTNCADSRGAPESFTTNMTTATVLAGIAAGLIAARAEAPAEPHLYRNSEEEDDL